MKKSHSVQIGLLASVAAALTGCENSTRVHLDQYGRCVSDGNGSILSPSICNGGAHAGGGGYYYGGSHYVYSSPASSGTVRGIFGGSASGHGFFRGSGRMRRKRCDPRRDWESTVSKQGLTFHTPGGQRYWDETVCYEFTAREIDEIEAATNELQRLCLEAGQFIIDKNRFEDLKIPAAAIPAIKAAWEAEPPSIYGRFDLAYNGLGPPKMLEYNANTPTALVEAAVIQWYWLKDVFPTADQFNSIHEKLIAQWTDVKPYLNHQPLYFTSADAREDVTTVSYLQDTANQAGVLTRFIEIADIGWNRSAAEFRDLRNEPISNIFALYPWEWLLGEYPDALLRVQGRSIWIEPIWKMMWSNKGLLAILWEMFPGHPNLLESYLDSPRAMTEYCRKPLLSREGANILLKTAAGSSETTGEYGEEGYVYQAASKTGNFDGKFPVLGSWIVTDHNACGMGVRESDTPITDNLSRFVPHLFS